MTEPMKLSELPPALWQRVSDLFDEVLELDERERIAYIRTLWVDEPQVASELVALLVAAANVDKTAPLAQSPFLQPHQHQPDWHGYGSASVVQRQ